MEARGREHVFRGNFVSGVFLDVLLEDIHGHECPRKMLCASAKKVHFNPFGVQDVWFCSLVAVFGFVAHTWENDCVGKMEVVRVVFWCWKRFVWLDLEDMDDWKISMPGQIVKFGMGLSKQMEVECFVNHTLTRRTEGWKASKFKAVAVILNVWPQLASQVLADCGTLHRR